MTIHKGPQAFQTAVGIEDLLEGKKGEERALKENANFAKAWTTQFASKLIQQKLQDIKGLLLLPMLSIRESIDHGVTDSSPIASKHGFV